MTEQPHNGAPAWIFAAFFAVVGVVWLWLGSWTASWLAYTAAAACAVLTVLFAAASSWKD